MPENIYQFGDRQLDMTTTILKDGKPSSCPEAHRTIVPSSVQGQFVIWSPACNKECMKLMAAAKTNKEEGTVEHGYVMTCLPNPKFIKINEAVGKKPKLTIN